MFSKSSKYAIKGVLYLALHSDENHKIMARDLAEPINAPQSYIAKLLQELVRHGIVSSSKGPHGGFYMNPGNKKTFLIEIINVIDGGMRLRSCVLSIEECDYDNPCPLHNLAGDAKANFVKLLEMTTVESLIEDIREGKSVLPL